MFGILGSYPLKAARKLGRHRRRYPVFGPLVGLAAGVLLPAQVILAGNSSARRPEEYLAYTQPGAPRGKFPALPVPPPANARWNGVLRKIAPFGLAALVAGAITIALWRKGEEAI